MRTWSSQGGEDLGGVARAQGTQRALLCSLTRRLPHPGFSVLCASSSLVSGSALCPQPPAPPLRCLWRPEPRPSLSQAGFPPPSSTHRALCPTRGVLPWTLRLLSLPASSDFRRHWSGSSQPAFLEAQSHHPCRQKPAPFSECTGSMAPSVPRGIPLSSARHSFSIQSLLC